MKFTLQGQVIQVEGKGGKEFSLGLLAKLGKKGVRPTPPNESSTLGNGGDNVIKYIPQLIAAIEADEVTHAAIVVDADHTTNNGGFAARRHQIAEVLASSGFVNLEQNGTAAGEIFTHPTNPAAIGLFILPNHQDDGMLEDLLKEMVVHHPWQN